MYLIILSLLNMLVVFFLILNSKKIGNHFSINDKPKKTSIHKRTVPLTGGIILIFPVLSFFYFEYLNNNLFFREFVGLMFISSSFFLIGFFDDRHNLFATTRIFLTLFFITFFFLITHPIFFFEEIYLISLDRKINLGFIFLILMSLIIISLQNALNLIDGINCLLKLFSIFVFISLVFLSDSRLPNSYLFLIIFPLLIMIFFNFKNYFFLGSSGNSLVTILCLYLCFDYNIEFGGNFPFEFYIVIFLIPTIDMLRLFFIRLYTHGKILLKDQNHFHHNLLKKFGTIYANIFYLSICFFPVLVIKFSSMNYFMCIILTSFLFFSCNYFIKK